MSTKQQYSLLDDLIAYNYGAIAVCTMMCVVHGVCHLAVWLRAHGLA